jgi:hypothetical protein
MIDGLAVIDAHMHVPRLSTVLPAWMKWAEDFGQDSPWRSVFGPDGNPVPARLDALLDAEGVDAALLFAEYSPRATGIQPVEGPPKPPASSASAPSRSSCTPYTAPSARPTRPWARSTSCAPSAGCR